MLQSTRSKAHQLLSKVFISCSILILVRQGLAFCKFTGQYRDLIWLLNFLLQYCRSPYSTTNTFSLFFYYYIFVYFLWFTLLQLVWFFTDKNFNRCLFSVSWQWNHWSRVWDMFEVSNKDTRTMPASFWCLYCWLWACFPSCFGVSVVDFEQVIAGWCRVYIYVLVCMTKNSFSLFLLQSRLFLCSRTHSFILISHHPCSPHNSSHLVHEPYMVLWVGYLQEETWIGVNNHRLSNINSNTRGMLIALPPSCFGLFW